MKAAIRRTSRSASMPLRSASSHAIRKTRRLWRSIGPAISPVASRTVASASRSASVSTACSPVVASSTPPMLPDGVGSAKPGEPGGAQNDEQDSSGAGEPCEGDAPMGAQGVADSPQAVGRPWPRDREEPDHREEGRDEDDVEGRDEDELVADAEPGADDKGDGGEVGEGRGQFDRRDRRAQGGGLRRRSRRLTRVRLRGVSGKGQESGPGDERNADDQFDP